MDSAQITEPRVGRLLNAEEYQGLEQALGELKKVASTDDTDTIDRLTHALNDLSQDFAARRMDAGISQALTGHTLDELER